MKLNRLNVSVIIPTCDRPQALERALASVNASVERLFVVDDCSSAGTLEEVSRVCGADSRVQLLTNSMRRGASFCRNLGVAQAQGEWLLFLDDDDQFCDGYLDSMVALLEEYPEVQAWIPNVQGSKSRMRSPVPMSHAQTHNRVGGCSGFLIKKALFEEVNGFDPNFDAMQDWDFWLRLITMGALHYSGASGVVYAYHSKQKITHDLSAKYRGLRRLYFKHRELWTAAGRHKHLLRLRVLRRLLGGKTALWLNFYALGFRASALYYTYRWRPFLKQPQVI